ncbi:hypothetical protein SAY87_017201 [Trapa incisa]|uniref:GATA-type domain-containing protein n=2 Tax=Trapa TaxID=22665 RepID=A0AAN7M3P0_TRANT|nr:hypothetical protein SAY87_017201 [Trapa incisa]KAK4791093.1 hypothetical protein SAY86_031506 [Trapa natans]
MHQYGSSNDSFSVFFPDTYSYQTSYPHSYSPASSSSTVDCTLSLGTPSTRLCEDSADDGTTRRIHQGTGQERRSSISTFCWDILRTTSSSKNAPTASVAAVSNKSAGRGGGDPLLARRCANCDTTSTPLWRNGPRGPKSLCNACGIRFKKEERRATAAAATATASTGGAMDAQAMFSNGQYGSWAAAASTQSHHHKLPCYGTEFRFIDDEALDHSDNGISFLSWRLNVADRPNGLIHDFTR